MTRDRSQVSGATAAGAILLCEAAIIEGRGGSALLSDAANGDEERVAGPDLNGRPRRPAHP